MGIILAFVLVGCSEKDRVNVQANNDEYLVKLEKENEELKQLLEERPNVSNKQLRKTMNLSLKIIYAMVNRDYEFLQSIVDHGIVIDREKDSFIFNDGFEQSFIKPIEYEKFEYRAHFAKDDEITVAFGENSIAYYFRFKQTEDKMVLISYLTN